MTRHTSQAPPRAPGILGGRGDVARHDGEIPAAAALATTHSHVVGPLSLSLRIAARGAASEGLGVRTRCGKDAFVCSSLERARCGLILGDSLGVRNVCAVTGLVAGALDRVRGVGKLGN